MNVTLVPTGNARRSDNGTITCQHGQEECEGNRWQQCSIAHYPAFSDHFPFYKCMEGSDLKLSGDAGATFPVATVKKCAKTANMHFGTLETCFDGDEGQALMQTYFDLTPAGHTYVPWVVIDGATMGDSTTFIDAVCNAYKGTKPAGCTALASPDRRCFA